MRWYHQWFRQGQSEPCQHHRRRAGRHDQIRPVVSRLRHGFRLGLLTFASDENTVVSLTLADVQFEIGKLGLEEGSFPHAMLHGLAGCAAAEATGVSCAAGAAGAIAQSLYAGTTDEFGRHLNAEEYTNTAEFIGAFAGFLLSSGNAENVNVAALVAESGFENNALCGGVCVAALVAAGYVLLSGNGDPVEGLQTIGRGEDLVSELSAAAGEKGIAFASSHFPEETAAVIDAMVAVGEAANVVVSYVDASTGHTVSGAWNELSPGVQDAIKGGTTVASFVIPAGTASKISRVLPDKKGVGGVPSRVPNLVIDSKIQKQMSDRGWTRQNIDDLIEQGPSGRTTDNRRPNKTEDGIGRNDTATVYGSSGNYVVVNDRTGEIVQVSGRNDPSGLIGSKESVG